MNSPPRGQRKGRGRSYDDFEVDLPRREEKRGVRGRGRDRGRGRGRTQPRGATRTVRGARNGRDEMDRERPKRRKKEDPMKRKREAARNGTTRGKGQREETTKSRDRSTKKERGRERSGAYREDREAEALRQRKKITKRMDKRRETARAARADRRERGRPTKSEKSSPEKGKARRSSKDKKRERNNSGRSAKDSNSKKKSPTAKVETFKRAGRGGGEVYKRKEEKELVVEETKENEKSPVKEVKEQATKTAGGPRWVSKADIEAKEEEKKMERVSREQQRTRGMVSRIFKGDKGGGMSEEETQSAIAKVLKQQLLRQAKRRNNRSARGRISGGGNSKYQVKLLSTADVATAESEAKAQSLEVIEAMLHGFLSAEYAVDLDEQFGHRTYRKKKERREGDNELNEEEAKEMDDMAERFHANIGHSFGLSDVRKFFGDGAENKKLVEKLCNDLKHNIFDELFEATKKTSTGEYVFLRKETDSAPTATAISE